MTDSVPEFDSLELRRVFGHFPTSVTIVTTMAADQPVGMTVGSFFSVSLEPALVGFCAGKESSTWPQLEQAGAFAVNLLAADQEHLSSLFAGPDPDRFAGIDWRRSATGSPLLPDVIGWIDCTTEQLVEAGDHWIVIGRVQALEIEREVEPLVFYRGGYGTFTADLAAADPKQPEPKQAAPQQEG